MEIVCTYGFYNLQNHSMNFEKTQVLCNRSFTHERKRMISESGLMILVTNHILANRVKTFIRLGTAMLKKINIRNSSRVLDNSIFISFKLTVNYLLYFCILPFCHMVIATFCFCL